MLRVQLQENSQIIKELAFDMGMNAKLVSDRMMAVFHSLIWFINIIIYNFYILNMYRHLYRNPTILSRILIKEFANYKSEEYGYRYAALS